MRAFACLGLVLILVACGGASSGDSSPQGNPQPPGPQLPQPTTVGAALNRFEHGAAGAPSLQVVGGTLYAAWHESEKVLTTDPNAPRYLPAEVFVSAWTGTEWKPTSSGGLNVSAGTNAIVPQLATDGTVLYLAFNEWISATASSPRAALLYVKRWDGQQWMSVGGPLNVGAETGVHGPPAIGIVGGVLHVAWTEYSERTDSQGQPLDVSKVYVKKWTGQDWIQLGGPLNYDPAKGRASQRWPLTTAR